MACEVETRFVCVGQPSVCRAQPQLPGDVVVTEIFKNPAGSEVAREWFELHNPTASEWDLQGVTIADTGTDSFVIDSTLPLPAGGTIVLASSGNTAANGGLNPDFVFAPTAFRLGNDADEVRVFPLGSATAMDAVDYNDANFPDVEGVALSLDPAAYDPGDNDNGLFWCNAVDPYGDGSGVGTPGEINPACR